MDLGYFVQYEGRGFFPRENLYFLRLRMHARMSILESQRDFSHVAFIFNIYKFQGMFMSRRVSLAG